ncbi:MAG: tetraacyldisaccharide 4'-kinase [Chlamydiales bacterium]|nr:tetraacyldisaccharide 4'-kinase [Chlamydiales bacterium]
MKARIESRLVDMIRKGKWAPLTRCLSWFYAYAIRARHWLYDNKWLVQKQTPLPVVSIGNLVAGGVGKTQVTLLLAEELKDVAILSRGYRGQAEKGKEPLLVLPERTAEECGDEPRLLASRLPHALVIVHRDRYRSALKAEKLGARVLLLDDGMQHRRLFRNIEIVVLGGSDPFGGGSFLPRGFLREDPERLERADLVVFVGKPAKWVEEKVAGLTQAPCVETQVCVRELRLLDDEPIHSLEGKKIGIFCGIGNPTRFAASMKELGAELVAVRYLPDHRTIGEKELRIFAALCKQRGAEYILCTEKDRVKLPGFVDSCPVPIGWAGVELEIVRNREAWDRMMKEITLLAGIRR